MVNTYVSWLMRVIQGYMNYMNYGLYSNEYTMDTQSIMMLTMSNNVQ